MTLGAAALAAMPRTTPTAIAEAGYEAKRARRYPPVGGFPDPRAAWRRTVDPGLLKRYIALAFEDHLATIATPATRAQIAQELLADVDRRYPPADMAVLARYGLARRIDILVVDTAGGSPQRFSIPPRELPAPMTGLHAHSFTTIDAHASRGVAMAPAVTLPVFAAIDAAKGLRVAEFEAAEAWPAAFAHREKHPPTWGEIEAAWPRIGAWLAKKREQRDG